MNANAKSAKANLYRATSIDLELPVRKPIQMWTWLSEYLTNYVSSKELARKFRGTCHEISDVSRIHSVFVQGLLPPSILAENCKNAEGLADAERGEQLRKEKDSLALGVFFLMR